MDKDKILFELGRLLGLTNDERRKKDYIKEVNRNREMYTLNITKSLAVTEAKIEELKNKLKYIEAEYSAKIKVVVSSLESAKKINEFLVSQTSQDPMIKNQSVEFYKKNFQHLQNSIDTAVLIKNDWLAVINSIELESLNLLTSLKNSFNQHLIDMMQHNVDFSNIERGFELGKKLSDALKSD